MGSAHPHVKSLARDESPEIGSAAVTTQYNKRTGRPIRSNAGRIKRPAAMIDSSLLEDENGEPLVSSEDEVERVITRKRKRSPSPEPPALERIVRDDAVEDFSEEEEDPFQKRPGLPPVALQFNVPLGFHGPLTVKLDRSMFKEELEEIVRDLIPEKPKRMRKIEAATAAKEQTPSKKSKNPKGFLSLPPELRNKIYRHLFVSNDAICFPTPRALTRSSQLLSTCRTVHSEGCSILYGENEFSFDRNTHRRGQFWEPAPKEIGYKDVRQFLNMIGPENLAYLRDIVLNFEDARPVTTPSLSHEARRFINDEQLIDVLRILRLARLRKVTLKFYGRRIVTRNDDRFITYLQQIKADQIVAAKRSPLTWNGYNGNKIDLPLMEDLEMSMTRKRKLYGLEE